MTHLSLKHKKHVVQRPTDLKSFGLENPWLKYSVTFEEQEIVAPTAEGDSPLPEGDSQPAEYSIKTVSRNLSIGNRVGTEADSNYYAITEDNSFVFEIASEIVDFV